MNRGTILYVGAFELPDKNAAAHRVLSNAKIFKKLNYEVVFIGIDTGLSYKNKIINTRKEMQGFDCWAFPYPKSLNQWIDYYSNINAFLEVINNYSNVKAVICYNYMSLSLRKIKQYCNLMNIKIIADCTEWYSIKNNKMIIKIIKGFDNFLRMRVISKRLDGLIVISSYLEDYYRKCKNVILIPPLVDMTEKKWSIAVPKYDNDKIRFIYAGNPGKDKDKISTVVDCLYNLEDSPNYIFNIVGITKEEYIKDYREHKEFVNNFSDNIIFHGQLSHIEIVKLIKISDFMIFIRKNNRMTKAGFPTKFVESMSCGTPVITTRTSDLENYLVEGKNGFFLEIEDKKQTKLDLQKILRMSYDEINLMKTIYIDTKMFHYENYIDKMKIFLNNVFIDSIC